VGEERTVACRRVGPDPRERLLVVGARGANELLRLLSKLLEVHLDLLPSGPSPRRAGKRSVLHAKVLLELCSALPADRMRPHAQPDRTVRPRAGYQPRVSSSSSGASEAVESPLMA